MHTPLPLYPLSGATTDDVASPTTHIDDCLEVPKPSPLARQVGGNHYKGMAIQPIEFIHANNIPFIEGCIVKYASRWRGKGGIADLRKIIHFAELLISLEEKKDGNKAP